MTKIYGSNSALYQNSYTHNVHLHNQLKLAHSIDETLKETQKAQSLDKFVEETEARLQKVNPTEQNYPITSQRQYHDAQTEIDRRNQKPMQMSEGYRMKKALEAYNKQK